MGMPLSLQQDFLTSIDKVWDEPVDLMLGNHPFHNDTYQKYARLCRETRTRFWTRESGTAFSTSCGPATRRFLAMTPEQVEAMYAKHR